MTTKSDSHPGGGALRAGIIGCGLIADTHVEAIQAVDPNAEIAVVDPVPGKAALLARKYRLKASFTDVSRMLAEFHPSAVHVVSPPHWHVAHARQSLEAGAHVMVEKPLCFNLAEAEELYRLAEQKGLALSVDHSLLYQPSVLKAREALKSSATGILQFESFYGLDDSEGAVPSMGEHWKERLPGGALMDSLVHPLSLAVSIAGAPVEMVHLGFKGPGGEQLRIQWRTEDGLVGLTVAQGIQPFRRFSQISTGELTCFIDHSSEVCVVLTPGAGPKAIKKVAGNLGYSWQLASGTFQTVWKVARKKLQQNPGARSLIAAFYAHVVGQGENPTSKESVLGTTRALEEVASLVRPPELAARAAARNVPVAEPDRGNLPKVLVTGASGFLGRNLCRELIVRGQREVLAQVRRGPNAEKLPNSKLLSRQYLDFDAFTAEDFKNLLQGVKEVVHCAHAAGAKTWEDYEKRNVAHSLALYEAAAAAGCEKFIHVSSLAVYGLKSKNGQPIDETAPLRAGTSRWDYYIASKAKADEELIQRAAKGGPELLILRLGILYSPEGERLFSKSIPTKAGRLFICIGNGRNHLPYTRVDLVADLIVRALENREFPTGVFNVAGEQQQDFKTFLSVNCERKGIESKFLHLPALPLRMGAWCLESLYFLLGRSRPPKLSSYVIGSATRDLRYDCTKAGETLGWNSSHQPSAGETDPNVVETRFETSPSCSSHA